MEDEKPDLRPVWTGNPFDCPATHRLPASLAEEERFGVEGIHTETYHERLEYALECVQQMKTLRDSFDAQGAVTFDEVVRRFEIHIRKWARE